MLETIIMQVDIFSSIESLNCGMPYPILAYLYLLKRTRQGYISFYGHIFYQTLDMTALVHFIFYEMFQHTPPPFNVTV